MEEFVFRLGVFCQKYFNMSDGFRIELPKYDISHVFVLRYSMALDATMMPVTPNAYPVAPGIIEEEITLEQVSDAWCGYSRRGNTLVVMFEPRGN